MSHYAHSCHPVRAENITDFVAKETRSVDTEDMVRKIRNLSFLDTKEILPRVFF